MTSTSASPDLSPETALQTVALSGVVFGAWGSLSPGSLHRVYGTGEVDATTAYMTRMWGGALAAVGALALLAPAADRARTLQVAAAMNGAGVLFGLTATGVPGRARAGATLTSALLSGVAAYGASRAG